MKEEKKIFIGKNHKKSRWAIGGFMQFVRIISAVFCFWLLIGCNGKATDSDEPRLFWEPMEIGFSEVLGNAVGWTVVRSSPSLIRYSVLDDPEKIKQLLAELSIRQDESKYSCLDETTIELYKGATLITGITACEEDIDYGLLARPIFKPAKRIEKTFATKAAWLAQLHQLDPQRQTLQVEGPMNSDDYCVYADLEIVVEVDTPAPSNYLNQLQDEFRNLYDQQYPITNTTTWKIKDKQRFRLDLLTGDSIRQHRNFDTTYLQTSPLFQNAKLYYCADSLYQLVYIDWRR